MNGRIKKGVCDFMPIKGKEKDLVLGLCVYCERFYNGTCPLQAQEMFTPVLKKKEQRRKVVIKR